MDQGPSVRWGFTPTALIQQSLILLPWAGMACHAPTRWDYDLLGIFSAKFRYGTAQVVDCQISLLHQSNDFDFADGLKLIRTVWVYSHRCNLFSQFNGWTKAQPYVGFPVFAGVLMDYILEPDTKVPFGIRLVMKTKGVVRILSCIINAKCYLLRTARYTSYGGGLLPPQGVRQSSKADGLKPIRTKEYERILSCKRKQNG